MRVSQDYKSGSIGHLTQQLWSLCMNIPYQNRWMWMCIELGKELSCWRGLIVMLCLMRVPMLRSRLSWSMLKGSSN